MTTTAHQLRARRRVTAASQRRHPPRVLPAAQPPNGVVTAYKSALLGLTRQLDAEIARELADLGVPVRTDARGNGLEDLFNPSGLSGLLSRLSAFVGRLLGAKQVATSVVTVAQRTVAHSRAQWAAQVKAAVGVDLTADIDAKARIASFRRENVKLIRSLLDEKVERVHRVLTEAGSGTRVETIRRRIEQEADAARSRADLIARDQVLKLNAQVTEDRHRAAGVTEYVWRTSRDERVREAHKKLDGTRHRYDAPPVVDPKTGRREHPGGDFQCRCTAEPVIEGVDA